MDIGVACGIEMMSVEKMGKDFGAPAFMKLLNNFPHKLVPQGYSAEKIAVKYGITRAECDELAFESHRRCGLARDKGFFDRQTVPYLVTDKKAGTSKEVFDDEGIRYPPNKASLDKLKAVFAKNGVVTAGNASQISDGSSAILLASAEAVKKHGLRVRARIISRVVVGSDPIMMLDGVIPATEQALRRVGMKVDDIDLFEINEAFAVVPAAWRKTLGVDWEKVNVCGGACAHGHPLGATGCVLMTKLVNDLERTDTRYGLQTMCIGDKSGNFQKRAYIASSPRTLSQSVEPFKVTLHTDSVCALMKCRLQNKRKVTRRCTARPLIDFYGTDFEFAQCSQRRSATASKRWTRCSMRCAMTGKTWLICTQSARLMLF